MPKSSRYVCKHCSATFRDNSKLQSHLSHNHLKSISVKGVRFYANDDGNFICIMEGCNQQFSTPTSFRNHSHIRHLSRPGSSSGPSFLGPSRPPSDWGDEEEEPEEEDMEEQWEQEYLDYLKDSATVDIKMASPQNSSGSEFNPAMDITPPQHPSNKPVKPLVRPPSLKKHNLGIDPEHKLLICEDCGYAIQRRHLKNHFHTYHHNSPITPDLIKALDEHKVPEGMVPPPSAPITPVQSIKPQKGLYCCVPECHFITSSTTIENVKKNHFYSVHKGLQYQNMIKECTIQCIYHKPITCWRVDPYYNVFGGMSVDLRQMLITLRQQDAKGLDDGIIQAPENIRLARPFLRTLGWLVLTQDCHYDELEQLVAVPNHKKDEEFAWLYTQMHGYATHTRAINDDLNFIARQIVNTPTGDDPINKPFGPTQNESTMSRYLGYALSLFMMAIRTIKLQDAGKPLPIKIVLSDPQKQATHSLATKMASKPTTYQPGRNSLIHNMFKAFFFDIHPDFDKLAKVEPIGMWIMLASIESHTQGKFRDAAPIVSILGGMQWVMRLAAIYEVNQCMTQHPREENAVSHAWELRNRWLRAGSGSSAFSTIHRISTLCSTVAFSETSHSSIQWNNDFTRLTLGDSAVNINDLPLLYNGLMKDASDQFDKLTHGHNVSQPPLDVMSDNMEVSNPEYSFMDARKEWMQQERFRGVDYRARSEGWIIYNDEVEGPRWNIQRMRDFMEEAEALLHTLMVLIHISNQPARATELFTMQIRNSQNVHRSFFASDSAICWILGYSKMSSKLGLERMIPRFAHEQLGQLLIKYLIYIRTTEEVFACKLWGDDAYRVLHTYMFWRAEGVQFEDADQFSPILKAATAKYLHAGLNVHRWRHLAAALGRLYLVIMEDNEDDTNMMDAAAGRTTTTSERIYALEPGDLGRLNIHVMAKFRAISTIWQNKAFGLTFRGGRVPGVDEVLQPITKITPAGLAPEITPSISQDLQTMIQNIVSQTLNDQLKQFLPQVENIVTLAVQKGVAATQAQVTAPQALPVNSIDNYDDLFPFDTQPRVSTSQVPPPIVQTPPSVPKIASYTIPKPTQIPPLLPEINTLSLMPTQSTAPTARPLLQTEPPVLPQNIDPRSLQRLKEAGFQRFRSIEQYQAYWLLKQRSHHLLYVAGTGSGKTMAYQLAMKSLGPEFQCVLLLPYRSLYSEMLERMHSFGLSAVHYDPREEFPNAQVIITSPGSLLQNEGLRAGIRASAGGNKMFAIIFDEAHTLIEDDDWRGDIAGVNRELASFSNVILLFLTGTIAPDYEYLIWEKLQLQGSPSTAVIRTPSTQRHNISYQVISAHIKSAFQRDMSNEQKEAIREEWRRQLPLLTSLIHRLEPGEKGLIFIRYVEKVEWWAQQLDCPYIHGGVTSDERTQIWDNWHNAITPVIVTNKAGAYGVDDPNVRFTVHIEDPVSLTEFTQGSGRAGRNGETALSLIILPFEYKRIKQGQDGYEGLVSMSQFLAGKTCRHSAQSKFLDGKAVTCIDISATMCDLCQRARQIIRGSGWDALIEPKATTALKNRMSNSSFKSTSSLVQSNPPSSNPPAPLAYSPIKPIPTAMRQEQEARQQASQQLDILLHSLVPAVQYFSRKQDTHCVRCLLLALHTRHEWEHCPQQTNHEVKWLPSSWEQWVKTIFGIKKDTQGNTCCTICMFAIQDTRFHSEFSGECLYPTIVQKIAFTVLYNSKVQAIVQEKLGLEWKNPTAARDWMLKPAFQDKRWLNCATVLVKTVRQIGSFTSPNE